MKELYDKVQESIKDSLKHFIPMGSIKRKADVTGERCKETRKEEKSYSYRRTTIKEAYIEDIEKFDAKRKSDETEELERKSDEAEELERKNDYRIQDYYKHIPPTGLGLILLGYLITIWETSATSDDDFWKNQEDWEIIRWRLNESSGVHTLELEDGTMIHMLKIRGFISRYSNRLYTRYCLEDYI
ncbi:hypothetical protein Tco_0273143 [Tanacetum coccineum]